MGDLLEPKRTKPTSTKLSGTATSKYAKLKSQTARGKLTWRDAPPDTLHAAIAAVTGDGAAILLTTTSDGGALVVRTIDDVESTPFYAADTDALIEALLQITDTANKP